MLLASILLGAAIIGIVATFWKEIVEWIQKAINKVASMVRGVVVGVKVFVRKIGEAFKEVSRHYSKVDETWQETIVTRTVSESEVPAEIRARANNVYELDITDELELQLSAS